MGGGRPIGNLRATERARRRYEMAARLYGFADEHIRREWRERAVAEARGQVLELGVGTGSNLPLYDPRKVESVTGVDFSSAMLAQAKGRPCRVPCRLERMDVQELAFADSSFDTVLATLVFCTVPDPVLGLREARRVVRPDGQVVLLEHVRVAGALGMLQDVFNPLTVWLIGDHINRRTEQNVSMAGLAPIRVDHVAGELLKLMVAVPIAENGPDLVL